MLKAEHGLGHGFANLAAITALRPADEPAGDELIEAMYAGPKTASGRPLHDAVVDAARNVGNDVELAPKKADVSLRRRKQFVTVGPGPAGRLEIGLNLPGRGVDGRLEPATGMCSHRVRVGSAGELDDQLLGWLREAYDRSHVSRISPNQGETLRLTPASWLGALPVRQQVDFRVPLARRFLGVVHWRRRAPAPDCQTEPPRGAAMRR